MDAREILCAVRQIKDQRGRQQMGGFGDLQGRARQRGRTVAHRPERSFHRIIQVMRRVGHVAHPGAVCIWRDDQAHQIPVIGRDLHRFGASRGQRQDRPSHRADFGQALRVQPLGRRDQGGAGAVSDDNRHAHAQIGAGTVQAFCGVGAKRHDHPGVAGLAPR